MKLRNALSRRHSPRRAALLALTAVIAVTACTASGAHPQLGSGFAPGSAAGTRRVPIPKPPATSGPVRQYPWHTHVVSTTFWVGEVFDPNAPDGSQVISTYDSQWEAHYGGCDGVVIHGVCRTEPRTRANGYFPTAMTPHQNPFYLDLPYDDVNDPIGFAERDKVIPWAGALPYAAHRGDSNFSYLKNRWVEIVGPNHHTCYGQIEDAGPSSGSLYHDAAYVFGRTDARPLNRLFNGAGMDVSPALNGCLGFQDLNGDTDEVSWRFVDGAMVPPGPWTRLITTTPYTP